MPDTPEETPHQSNAGAIVTGYTGLLLAHWDRLLILFAVGWAMTSAVMLVQVNLIGYDPKDMGMFLQANLLPIAFITGAVAQATLWGEPGDPVTTCLDVATRAFIPLLAITLVSRIVISAGLVALVLPGIALTMLFGLSGVIMIAERPSVFRALKESVLRVWRSFGAVLVSYIVYLISLLVLAFASAFAGGIVAAFLPGSLDGQVVGGAMTAMFSLSHTVFAVAIYKEISGAEV